MTKDTNETTRWVVKPSAVQDTLDRVHKMAERGIPVPKDMTDPPPRTVRTFDTGATRDTDKDKIHYKGFISGLAMWLFGEYMEKHRVQSDGSLREPDNWKRGIPIDAYEDSLIRHVMEFQQARERGDLSMHQQAQIMSAIFFNAQGWLHEAAKQRLAERPRDGSR